MQVDRRRPLPAFLPPFQPAGDRDPVRPRRCAEGSEKFLPVTQPDVAGPINAEPRAGIERHAFAGPLPRLRGDRRRFHELAVVETNDSDGSLVVEGIAFFVERAKVLAPI